MSEPAAPSPDAVRAAVEAAARRYFDERRAAVDGFARRAFGLRGALKLHAHAFGWDLLRAPANLGLGFVALGARLAAALLRRAGARRPADWLAGRRILIETDVAREARRLIQVDLLGLPHESDPHDALAEALLASPEVASLARAAAGGAAGEARRARVAEAFRLYGETRAATGEIATNLATLTAGAAAFKALTPGAFSLGPTLALAYAQSAAVASFPLGATLGGLWHGAFPVAASPALVAGATAGAMAAAAICAAFLGVIADPAQTALGLHQRRLRRLIDALERQFARGEGAGFAVREHYVARLGDALDYAAIVARALRG